MGRAESAEGAGLLARTADVLGDGEGVGVVGEGLGE